MYVCTYIGAYVRVSVCVCRGLAKEMQTWDGHQGLGIWYRYRYLEPLRYGSGSRNKYEAIDGVYGIPLTNEILHHPKFPKSQNHSTRNPTKH